MKLYSLNTIFIFSALILLSSCKSETELTMERGNYFYASENYNNAADQFTKIILKYSKTDISQLKNSEIELLAHAYQQLALCNAQLAKRAKTDIEKKIDYEKALENIKNAESLSIKEGKREAYRRTRLGIQNQLSKIKSSNQ